MRRPTDGETLTYDITFLSPVTGLGLPLDGYDVSAVTIAASDVTPATPTISRKDASTQQVRIDTTGLAGRQCRTRVTASDPLTSNVYSVDIPYYVEE